MKASQRFTVLAVVALIPSILFLWDGFESLRVTDAQIAGGAPEDTLGFGIASLLVLFGTPAVVLLGWMWWRVRRGFPRGVALVETFLFVGSLTFSVWAYALLKARVFK